VDTARREELIAHRLSVQEIAHHIGADSLGYLSLPGLFRAVSLGDGKLCSGCFTGNYPVPVQLEFAGLDGKLAMEGSANVRTFSVREHEAIIQGQLELSFDQAEMDRDRVPAGVDR
jgi:hypothetical protein